LLVFLLVLTFGLDLAATGTKCQSRNTSVAYLTLGPHVRLGALPSVRYISNTRVNGLLVFLLVLTFGLDLAATGTKCQSRNTSLPE